MLSGSVKITSRIIITCKQGDKRKMKRFLIELCEVLILCMLFPVLVIIFGAIDWSKLLFKILDETEKEIKEK